MPTAIQNSNKPPMTYRAGPSSCATCHTTIAPITNTGNTRLARPARTIGVSVGLITRVTIRVLPLRSMRDFAHIGQLPRSGAPVLARRLQRVVRHRTLTDVLAEAIQVAV